MATVSNKGFCQKCSLTSMFIFDKLGSAKMNRAIKRPDFFKTEAWKIKSCSETKFYNRRFESISVCKTRSGFCLFPIFYLDVSYFLFSYSQSEKYDAVSWLILIEFSQLNPLPHLSLFRPSRLLVPKILGRVPPLETGFQVPLLFQVERSSSKIRIRRVFVPFRLGTIRRFWLFTLQCATEVIQNFSPTAKGRFSASTVVSRTGAAGPSRLQVNINMIL